MNSLTSSPPVEQNGGWPMWNFAETWSQGCAAPTQILEDMFDKAAEAAGKAHQHAA